MTPTWFSIFKLCVFVVIFGHNTTQAYRNQPRLTIWNKHIEVSAKTLHVKAGSHVTLQCDAINSNKPFLRWYGPDRHWIMGNHQRIRVIESFSKQFLKLDITRIQSADQGEYICRGWFGLTHGFRLEKINLVVVNPPPLPTLRPITPSPWKQTITTTPPTTTTTAAVETTTTTTTTTKVAGPTSTAYYHVTTQEGLCLPPMFQCTDGGCLNSTYVCDNFPDCPGGTDEANCGTVSCLEGMFACRSGRECVSSSNRCDRIPHCLDGSDEAPELCDTAAGF